MQQHFAHAKLAISWWRRSSPRRAPPHLTSDRHPGQLLSIAHNMPPSCPLQVGLQLAIPSQPATAGAAGPSRFGPAFKAGPAGSVPGAPSGVPPTARAAPTREDLMTQHARRLTDLLDSFKAQTSPGHQAWPVVHPCGQQRVHAWAARLVLGCTGSSSRAITAAEVMPRGCGAQGTAPGLSHMECCTRCCRPAGGPSCLTGAPSLTVLSCRVQDSEPRKPLFPPKPLGAAGSLGPPPSASRLAAQPAGAAAASPAAFAAPRARSGALALPQPSAGTFLGNVRGCW